VSFSNAKDCNNLSGTFRNYAIFVKRFSKSQWLQTQYGTYYRNSCLQISVKMPSRASQTINLQFCIPSRVLEPIKLPLHFARVGHFDSITARFFGVPAARFHLFSFFCFMNKYDSISLKRLFLSTSPIASSRLCWGVYNCLEYDKLASVFVLCVR